MIDHHNNIKALRVISPVAVGTTGTGKSGAVIDLAGYGGCEFVIGYGAITSASAVFSPVVKECATSGGSFTSVADADLIGTELLAGIAAATRASGTTMNVTKRVGYRGSKRYVTVNLSSTVTAGTPISVDAVLFDPRVAPVSNP